MDATQLARVVAHHQGWQQDGGWIFADGVPIAQGYEVLGRKLIRLKVVVVGRGIDWSALRWVLKSAPGLIRRTAPTGV